MELTQNSQLPEASDIELNITRFEFTKENPFHASKIFLDAIDPIFISDLEDRVIDLNRAAEQVYGWTRSELIGGSMKILVVPDLDTKAEKLYDRCKRGERLEILEAIHITKSGDTFPVLLSFSLIMNERGEPTSIVTIVKGLSDLKRIHETLRAQIAALERSNKDLEQFAYVAAHDLREPLIGIAAYIKILERHMKHELDEKAHKLIARTIAVITRMDRLIQGLLWQSGLASETKHFEITDCNVVLEEALTSLKSIIEDNEALVKNELLPTVMANPALLIQLFQNLISNAIKFASDDPLVIRIGAQYGEHEWKFFVKDNGIGIEPPYFDRIFRIFKRIDSGADRPGTGIGLANCKKIVEYHEGRIWVESRPGNGSTFFFTIPHEIASEP